MRGFFRSLGRRLAAVGDAFLRPPVDEGQVWMDAQEALARIHGPGTPQRWRRKQAEALLAEPAPPSTIRQGES